MRRIRSRSGHEKTYRLNLEIGNELRFFELSSVGIKSCLAFLIDDPDLQSAFSEINLGLNNTVFICSGTHQDLPEPVRLDLEREILQCRVIDDFFPSHKSHPYQIVVTIEERIRLSLSARECR